ncbi:MAG: hypothetical protein ACXVY9_08580 [Terriglobales bacterium]
MKRTRLLMGTVILALGITGAAWAQPAPRHDRDANVYSGYNRGNDQQVRGDRNQNYGAWNARGDRDDGYGVWHARGDRDDNHGAWNARGDRDDNHGAWNARGDRDDQYVRRGDHDVRSSQTWGYSNMRHGTRDDR